MPNEGAPKLGKKENKFMQKINVKRQEVIDELNKHLKAGLTLQYAVKLVGGDNVSAYYPEVLKMMTKGISKIKLPDRMITMNTVFVPPGEKVEIKSGSGAGMEIRTQDRSQYLKDILTEINLSYDLAEGHLDPKMVRKSGYQAYIMREIDKIVLLCDEVGAKTYIITGVPDSDEKIESLASQRGEELEKLKGVQLFINPNDEEKWKARIKFLLTYAEREIPPSAPILKIPRREKAPPPPEGWVSRLALSRELKVSDKEILRMAKEYRNTPEWFGFFTDEKGTKREYFNPDLAQIIRSGKPKE